MIFLWFSTNFTRFSKSHILLKLQLFAKAPETFQYFTDMPSLCTKHLRQNERNAIGSLGHGGRRCRPKSGGSGGGVGWGRWGGWLGTHPRSVCELGWGRGTAGEGAPRHGRTASAWCSPPASSRPGQKGGSAARLQHSREARVRGARDCGIDHWTRCSGGGCQHDVDGVRTGRARPRSFL
jgi:hypothetical protein